MFLCASCSFSISRSSTRMSPRIVGVRRDGQQIVDHRRLLLAVAVNAAVPLLQGDQRPGDVEMDHQVAVVVQVHALGGDVRRQQDADRAVRLAERLDDAGLLHVRQAGMEQAMTSSPTSDSSRNWSRQEAQGRDALREDDDARRHRQRRGPQLAQERQQALVLGESSGVHRAPPGRRSSCSTLRSPFSASNQALLAATPRPPTAAAPPSLTSSSSSVLDTLAAQSGQPPVDSFQAFVRGSASPAAGLDRKPFSRPMRYSSSLLQPSPACGSARRQGVEETLLRLGWPGVAISEPCAR